MFIEDLHDSSGKNMKSLWIFLSVVCGNEKGAVKAAKVWYNLAEYRKPRERYYLTAVPNTAC